MIEIYTVKRHQPRPSEGRGRTFESYRVRHIFQTLSDKIEPALTGENRTKRGFIDTLLTRKATAHAESFFGCSTSGGSLNGPPQAYGVAI